MTTDIEQEIYNAFKHAGWIPYREKVVENQKCKLCYDYTFEPGDKRFDKNNTPVLNKKRKVYSLKKNTLKTGESIVTKKTEAYQYACAICNKILYRVNVPSPPVFPQELIDIKNSQPQHPDTTP